MDGHRGVVGISDLDLDRLGRVVKRKDQGLMNVCLNRLFTGHGQEWEHIDIENKFAWY
jgi:hypothetical protein